MAVPTADEIARIDVSSQLADVLGLPSQLEDAVWRTDTAELQRHEPIRQRSAEAPLLVCGMGGSAVGGDLAAAALDGRLTRPLITVRGYELPSWATPESVVLCSSYSGDTEETLACYEAAGTLGAARVVVTTGGQLAEMARADGVPVIGLPAGLQPRAAVGYMLVSTLEVAATVGAGPGIRSEIDAACSHLAELAAEWGPNGEEGSFPKRLAEDAHGACLCIYGAGPTAAVAHRWKTQINENAKLPAFASELPEADHNELVGWEGAPAMGSFFAVFLEDSDQHPRIRHRIEITSKLIADDTAGCVRVEGRGKSPLERVLSLVLLGDLVSIYLAVLRGVDPTPVPVIDELKRQLARQPIG
jgi:glucose/mannose-6-phosphate isomerase